MYKNREIQVTLWNIDIAKASFLEHEMILSEIQENLPELARGHIRYHLHRLDKELESFMKVYPDYFETGKPKESEHAEPLIAMK